MSKKALTQLWSALSLFVLTYTLNVWLELQGAMPIFAPALLHSSRVGIIVIALVILPVLHALANLVALRHAGAYGSNWASRLPLFFLEDIDARKRDAQWYQGVVAFLFVILPFFAFVHFFRKLIDPDNSILCEAGERGSRQEVPGQLWSWPSGAGLDDPCRLASSTDAGSITFFPLIEPLVILLLIGMDLVLACRLIWRILGCKWGSHV